MKIAILGTRGIPNRYGGFEQCAEKLALLWTRAGHKVTVYCPAEHPLKDPVWQGIRRRLLPSFENRLGPWGTLIYDFLCLKEALKAGFEVILNLGYVPAGFFFPRRLSRPPQAFVTNMDGLEWKRQKWSLLKRRFAKLCEKKAARRSDHLVADNPGIRDYLLQTYGPRPISFIPYGAEIPPPPSPTILQKYHLSPFSYYLIIARLEPENNIELILKGYLEADVPEPFVIVGNLSTPYARKLLKKFTQNKIHFLGTIYNYQELASLRHFAKIYFHGHSVGGTNPSLLEAMAAKAFIAAHDNPFNHYVLREAALYFSSSDDVRNILRHADHYLSLRGNFSYKNICKIINFYRWDKVAHSYLTLFERIITG